MSRLKPGKKNLCYGQVGKNCGNVTWLPRISSGRYSPAIARSWELALLCLQAFVWNSSHQLKVLGRISWDREEAEFAYNKHEGAPLLTTGRPLSCKLITELLSNL